MDFSIRLPSSFSILRSDSLEIKIMICKTLFKFWLWHSWHHFEKEVYIINQVSHTEMQNTKTYPKLNSIDIDGKIRLMTLEFPWKIFFCVFNNENQSLM